MKHPLCISLLLLLSISAIAQSTSYTVTSGPVDPPTTSTHHHHKEPVVIVDRAEGVDRITAAWISFPSSLDSSEARIQVSTTTNLAQWQPPVTLSSTHGTGTTGDPFFALNPVNQEVYLVGVGGGTEIRLWTREDFTVAGRPGTQVCYMYGADKPSVAVSPSGKVYVAHLATPNTIHVHQWDRGADKWPGIELVRSGGLFQSPIVTVNRIGASQTETVSVLFEDYGDSVNDKILAWSAPTETWTFTNWGSAYETPPQYSNFTSLSIGRLLQSPEPQEITGTTGSLKIPSMLMARYNPATGKIGIVWHERENGAEIRVKLVEFDPNPSINDPSKRFGSPIPVASGGNHFHPAIEANADGSYMISYYDAPAGSINYRQKLAIVHGTCARREPVTIAESFSTPASYGTEIGEYTDIRLASGSWYAAYIKVAGACSTGACSTGVCSNCQGDTYVTKITPSCALDVSPICIPSVAAGGGSVHFAVTMTPEGCTTWSPASDSSWAYIDDTSTRNTSGGFNVVVQSNPGAQRQATITTDGNSVVITQQAQGCATLPRRVAVAPALASRTDRPIATTVGGGSEGPLFYDWYERLPGETTPRLYYKHTSSIYVTPSQPLTYYSAVVRNSCGQSVSLAEVPIYLCVPTIDAQPVAEQFVPRGGSASLTIAASPAVAGQPVTITWWSYDTGQIVGNGPTLNVTPAPGAMQTYLAHVGTDCSGLPFSMQSQTATVRGCELAASAYGDRTITLGQGAPLSSSISGTQVLPSDAEYNWYSGPAPGTEYASGVGLWTITPTPMSTTTYWVRVKDGTCTADSNTVTVRISAPRDAQVLSQNVPTTMNARRSYTVSTTLKNVGTQSWSPVGPSPQCNVFRLGSTNPQDNVTWGRLRADLPAAVAPDGQVTVTFPVTAPDAPGTYNFQWKMLQECVTWFGDSTPNVAVNVQSAPARDTQVLSQSVPTTMTAGHVYPVSVTLKNVGTETWSPIGASPQCNVYRLGSANPQDNLIWGRMRADLPTAVAPGSLVTINFNVTAPSTSGTYNFQWRMLQECVTWFGDSTPNVGVTVNP